MKTFYSRRSELETSLNQLPMPNDSNADREASETKKPYQKEGNQKRVEETSKSDKGKAVDATVVSGTQSNGRDAETNEGKGNNKSKKGKRGKEAEKIGRPISAMVM